MLGNTPPIFTLISLPLPQLSIEAQFSSKPHTLTLTRTIEDSFLIQEHQLYIVHPCFYSRYAISIDSTILIEPFYMLLSNTIYYSNSIPYTSVLLSTSSYMCSLSLCKGLSPLINSKGRGGIVVA